MAVESTVKGKYLLFKGKPLVREGNQICYGDLQKDEYVMYLMIIANKKIKIGDEEVEVPAKVIGQIIKSDPTVSPLERMVKQFDRNNLYEAFTAGLIQLERLEKK